MLLHLYDISKQMFDQGRTAHLAQTLLPAVKFEVIFDPENIDHRKAYASYLKYGKWSSLRFHIEAPFHDVIVTINHKLLRYTLKEEMSVV